MKLSDMTDEERDHAKAIGKIVDIAIVDWRGKLSKNAQDCIDDGDIERLRTTLLAILVSCATGDDDE